MAGQVATTSIEEMTMPEAEPFESMNFRVKWDGRYVPGISKISGLRWSAEVVVYREGGDPIDQKLPGRSTYEPMTLERGITPDLAFGEWTAALLGRRPGLNAFKDVVIELYDEDGAVIAAYTVYRCWPSGYEALPVLDCDADAIAVERLVLQYSSFERDTSVVEPSA